MGSPDEEALGLKKGVHPGRVLLPMMSSYLNMMLGTWQPSLLRLIIELI